MTPPDRSITACLVCRHEEAVVDRCLRSLHDLVDEIIVIHDGPCEDRTLEIARGYGARTAELPLVGHAEQHTVTAFEWAASEWILSIDADEFLSDDLREHLPEMVADAGVNGYELLWRMWDGERYITKDGPYKRSLFRKRAVHLVGMIHGIEEVDPPVRVVPWQLEHQPLYNNFALPAMWTKWRRWARIHARELLMPLESFPQFNIDPPRRWGPRRRVLNVLSPVLLVPYTAATFWANWRKDRSVYSPREALRFSAYGAAYNAMVQVYLVRMLYVDRLLGRS